MADEEMDENVTGDKDSSFTNLIDRCKRIAGSSNRLSLVWAIHAIVFAIFIPYSTLGRNGAIIALFFLILFPQCKV